MEKTNYVFESPADEAFFNSVTPLSVRTDVFPVVYGPEEEDLLREVLNVARLFPVLRGEGEKVLLSPRAEGGLFNPNDGEAFFRVREGREARTVFFRVTASDTGLFPEVLNSEDETNSIEVFSVNYFEEYEAEREGLFRTRVFFRTTGLRPDEAYQTPRYFDLIYGENIETLSDCEARKEVDRIKAEAEARKKGK